MRYQHLYNAVKAKDGKPLFVRVSDNVVPFDGWWTASRLDFDLRDTGRGEKEFDILVSGVLSWTKDIDDKVVALAIRDGTVWSGLGYVFAHERKEYAMGFSHGMGSSGIHDVGSGKLIRRS